jgi:hypothetical protein
MHLESLGAEEKNQLLPSRLIVKVLDCHAWGVALNKLYYFSISYRGFPSAKRQAMSASVANKCAKLQLNLEIEKTRYSRRVGIRVQISHPSVPNGDREFSLKREAKVKTDNWALQASAVRDGKVDVQS